MSLLKTNAAQIGQSLTTTNNFTMYQPASPDGTVRWGVGNAGSVTDIVTLNSSGNVGIGTNSPSTWGKLAVSGVIAAVNSYNHVYADSAGWIMKSTRTDNTQICGIYNPTAFGALSFYAGDTQKMYLSASGNLGVGVTPSAWSSINAVQVGLGASFFGSTANYNSYVSANGYYDGSNWIYLSNGYFGYYRISTSDGVHAWLTSSSGTSGGTVSGLATAMTLSPSGNLTVTGTVTSTGNTPQVTVYTSGSGTYTVPSGCRWLTVEMVGGGGGGKGGTGSTAGGNGGTGGNTTFGTSLLTAAGAAGAVGGSATINSPATGLGVEGATANGIGGNSATLTNYQGGAPGMPSAFGGAGASSTPIGAGGAARANSGSGGGGGCSTNVANQNSASGGGAGGYIKAWITSLSASYSYAVGSGGTAGTAGTGAGAGGAGGSGVIIVTAYF